MKILGTSEEIPINTTRSWWLIPSIVIFSLPASDFIYSARQLGLPSELRMRADGFYSWTSAWLRPPGTIPILRPHSCRTAAGMWFSSAQCKEGQEQPESFQISDKNAVTFQLFLSNTQKTDQKANVAVCTSSQGLLYIHFFKNLSSLQITP